LSQRLQESKDVASTWFGLDVTKILDAAASAITSSSSRGEAWKIVEALAADERLIPSVTFLTFLAVLGGFGQDDEAVGSPYPVGSTTYNKQIAEDFFLSRPLFVFRRLIKLAQITGAFNVKLLLDWKLGNLEKNEKERAKEALALSTQMGPTFIKLGQALSLRTDLIPEAYALELRQLQDAVPPFDTAEAMEIVRQELGITDLSMRFKQISPKPVASASIGQVYRATLLDGRDVAIKVQRPKILKEIALDLFLLRLITPLQVYISNAVNKLKTDQGDIDVALTLVDEWGRGFVAEVDYRLEAENTKSFTAAMKNRGLVSVTGPGVVDELSTSRIIVTEWMEGTRLDAANSPDVPRLCAVAVNSYLTQLLDTGVLHCDPHPGNLLRTKDGRLCILDFGMTLQVPKDLQYSLLEFISHINSEDYEALPQDFVNLGFSSPDKLAQLQSSGLTEGLAFAFRQLNKGGGPSKIRERMGDEFRARYGQDLTDDELRVKAREEMISRFEEQLKSEGVDVNGVTSIMEELSRRNRDLFSLPPYVLYVSRAFSTLEGIGLSIDPDYSILAQCYPYLAKRLMTDDSPRSAASLRTMLFGKGQFNPAKMLEMTSNFQEYTVSTTNTAAVDPEQAKEAQNALFSLLLTPEGSPMQNLLLEGAARASDAIVREGYQRAKESQGGRLAKALLKTPSDFASNLPLPKALRPLATPFVLPYEIAKAADHVLRKNDEDEASIESLKALWSLTLGASSSENSNSTSISVTNQIQSALSTSTLSSATEALRPLANAKNLQLVPPVVNNLSRRFVLQLLNRAKDRLESTHKQYKGLPVAKGTDDLNAIQITTAITDFGSSQAQRLVKTLEDA